MPWQRWILGVAACGVWVAAAVPVLAGANVGQPAPPLVAPALDGHDFDLGTMHGKVVVVNFWATWCGPCREEMPALDAFYRRYHDDGVEMIGISADRPSDRGDVVTVAKTIAYPVAMLRSATTNGFGLPRELPTTFIIDEAGVVRAEMRPDQAAVTEQSLAAVVLPLLSREAGPKLRTEHSAR